MKKSFINIWMKIIVSVIFSLIPAFGFEEINGTKAEMDINLISIDETSDCMTANEINQVSGMISEYDSVAVEQVEEEILKKAKENIEKYRKGDAVIVFKDESGKPLQNAEVEIHQQTHDFLFGCIAFDLVRGEMERADVYKQRFKELFNYAELPFYWRSYEATPGMTQWEDILPVVSWCKENGIITKGHPLIWTNPSGVPNWTLELPVSISEDLLKARVINTVNGFKGKIDHWDVVNEPVHTRTWNHRVYNYEIKDFDYGIKEPIPDIADYCEKAFKWAYAANPEGDFILNEFQQIVSLTVRQRFYDLVAELLKRNTPITGLGFQAHEPWDIWFSPKEVWATFDYYAEFGLPIHITEHMPQSSGKEITGGWRKGIWTKENQADYAEQFYTICFGHPLVASLTWMGLTDKRIYLPGGGLVDENYRPKPVYNRLNNLINEEWKTNLLLQIDKEGSVKFRGFYGNYNIQVKTNDGKIKSYEIHLNANEENKWVFKVEK